MEFQVTIPCNGQHCNLCHILKCEYRVKGDPMSGCFTIFACHNCKTKKCLKTGAISDCDYDGPLKSAEVL